MERTRRAALCGLGLVCSLVCMWAPAARAESCQADTDCEHGFNCQVTATSGCAAPAPCMRGSECPQPPPCETQEYRECVPGPCSVDSDCADGMVCYTEHLSVCSTASATPVACAPNTKCDAPVASTPPTCTDQTHQQCVPRYQLPCTAASDCGDGFRCEDEVICSCSGGSATPPTPAAAPDQAAAPAAADGGTATPPLAPAVDGGVPELPSKPDCECQPSGTKSCVVIDVDCEQDSDCPEHFQCSVVGTSGSAGCAVPAGDDPKGCESTPPPPVQVTKRCLPPYYYGGASVPSRDASGSGGLPTLGGVTTPTGSAEAPSGAAIPPTAPSTHNPGETAGAPGSTSHDDNAGPNPAGPRHARACSVLVAGAPRPSGATLWLAVAGLVAGIGLRRRRSR